MSNRDEEIINAAINGLIEYYPCLRVDYFIREIKPGLIVPNTGNDQRDYEKVRDQVEKAAKVNERAQIAAFGW